MHHSLDYDGTHSQYVWLTQLAGLALKEHDLSDADEELDIARLRRYLELSEDDVAEALAAILEENTALDAMADTLCA